MDNYVHLPGRWPSSSPETSRPLHFPGGMWRPATARRGLEAHGSPNLVGLSLLTRGSYTAPAQAWVDGRTRPCCARGS